MKLPVSLKKKELSLLGFILVYIFFGFIIYLYFTFRTEQVFVQPQTNKKITPTASKNFNFLIFGDSGTGSDEQKQLASLMENQDADLIIHTGDLAYNRGSYEEIQKNVLDIYKELFAKSAFYPSLGNHDYGTEKGDPFIKTFQLPGNERYYSFKYNDVLFIALDTNEPLNESPNEMLPWLQKTLENSNSKWTIVYFHHPPFSSKGLHGEDKEVQERLVPILEKNKVDFVFSGHEHNYQRTCYIQNGSCQGSGVLYIVTGGGGAPLYPVGKEEWYTAKQISAYHFILAQKSDCTIIFTVVSKTGEQLDRFSKSKCS